MRIAFNATALLSPFTGLAQYTYELATRLAADPAHEVEFFYGYGWGKEVRAAPLPGAGSWAPWVRRFVPRSYELARFFKTRRFRRRTATAGFDVYHEPNFLPLAFDGPVVTTVHDLSWIRYPQAHPPERVRAMNRHFEAGLRRSDLILTDSAFVKQEVIDVFGIATERILPIPLGVSQLFCPRTPPQTQGVLTPLGLAHGRYFLAVGTLEPRKNLAAALRAHAALPENVQRAYPLVLAGLKGWQTGALYGEMEAAVASGRVQVTGYLSRTDLATLIAGSTALVYPSMYEGFGLPPLEAMACGVATIVSNAASLPEVVGDTGLLVEPHDSAALRDAMMRLVDEPALGAQLGRRGLARAGGFTWERCVAQTLDAYRRAARG